MNEQYLALFLEEAQELWTEGQAALDAGGETAQQTFHRVAHTLKGMSATMGYEALAEAFHRLEEAAKSWQDPESYLPLWQQIGSAVERAVARGSSDPLTQFGADDQADAHHWWKLVVTRRARSPRAQLLQWHETLTAQGFAAIWPTPDDLRRMQHPQALWVQIAQTTSLSDLQRLPDIARLEPALPPQTDHETSARAHLRVERRSLDRLFDEIGQLYSHLRVLRTVPYGTVDWERQMREVHALSARAVHRVGALRLASLSTLMDTYERAAVEAARSAGKHVRVHREGQSLRIARETIESLRPLIPHVARNAIVHGIEPPEERKTRGKPETGALSCRAYPRGTYVVLELGDDGAGVNTERLRSAATARDVQIAPPATEADLLELLFLPSLSTQDEADGLAGRGVGLDAVKDAVETAGGTVQATHQPGQGFTLQLVIPVPLSLQPIVEIEYAGHTVGILDEQWETAASTHRELSLEIAALADQAHNPTQTIANRDGATLQVERFQPLGNMFLHALRPPLSTIDGAIGFYLDEDGIPRIVFATTPRTPAHGRDAGQAAS